MITKKMEKIVGFSWKTLMMALILSATITSQAIAWNPDLTVNRIFGGESANGTGNSFWMEMIGSDETAAPQNLDLGISYGSAQGGVVAEPQKEGNEITFDFGDMVFTDLVLK